MPRNSHNYRDYELKQCLKMAVKGWSILKCLNGICFSFQYLCYCGICRPKHFRMSGKMFCVGMQINNKWSVRGSDAALCLISLTACYAVNIRRYPSVGALTCHFSSVCQHARKNPKWRTATILKKLRKIAISLNRLPDSGEIWQADVSWPRTADRPLKFDFL